MAEISQDIQTENVPVAERKGYLGMMPQPKPSPGQEEEEIPSIRIAPVFEEAGTRKPVITEDPVLGPTLATEEERSIPEAAAKDIQVQTEGITFEDWLKTVDPKIVDFAKQDTFLGKRARVNLAKAYNQIAKAPTEEQVMIPLMRTGEMVPVDLEPDAMEKAERLVAGRKRIDELLVGRGITDPIVRQVMVDEFETGNFYESLAVRLAEAGQVVYSAIPLASVLAYNATGALIDAKTKGTSWFDEWGSRQNTIEQQFKLVYDDIEKGIPRPTMARAFNDAIRESLRSRVEKGIITEEQYQERAFITDEQGNRVEREFLSDEDASQLINLGFTELPFQEKFGVMFLENLPGMGAPGLIKGSAAVKKYDNLVSGLKGTDLGESIARIGDDPFVVLKHIENSGIKTGINKSALSIGLYQRRVSQEMDILTDQISEAGQKLDVLRASGVPKTALEYKVAKGEYDNLRGRMLRTKYTARAYPYIRETGIEALTISAAQLAGREFLSNTGMSPETAEMIGFLSGATLGTPVRAFGGKLIKMTSTPRGGVPKVLGKTLAFTAHVATLGSLKTAGVKFTDDTIEQFELATGTRLTGDEIRGIKNAIKLINSLSPADRQRYINAAEEYVELREELVATFPTEEQDEIRELFTLSFSNAMGLSYLGSVADVRGNVIDVRNLSGLDLKSVAQAQDAAFKQVEITERALNNLERAIESSGAQNTEAVYAFITGARQGIADFKNAQRRTVEDTLGQLDDIKRVVLSDPTIDIDENFLPNIIEVDTQLNELLGRKVDERVKITETLTTMYSNLSSRLALMKADRGKGREYYRGLNNATEAFIDAHLDSIWQKGHNAYRKLREMDSPPIDLTEQVEKMMSDAKVVGKDAYKIFFSPEGTFFKGKLGRQSMKVFNDMIERVIPNMDEVKELLKASGVSQQLVEDMTNIEIAIELSRINSSFKPFSKLNAYEVDVLRRTFRDYAYKVKDGMPGLSGVYEGYAQGFDDAIKKAGEEVWNAVSSARREYRTEVGDRLRPQGLLYKIDRSRQGGEIVSLSGDEVYRYAYGKDKPGNLFKQISNNITKATQGNFDAESEIVAEIGSLLQQFGDTVNGKRVFDLSTETGRAKFKALQDAIGEKVYADWVDKQIKVFERERGISVNYDYKGIKNEEHMNDIMSVPAIMPDGSTDRIPLVNLGDMYADHRNLEKFVRGNKAVQKQYSDFVGEYNNLDSKLRRNLANNIKAVDDAMDTLKPFTGGLNPSQFYQRYVIDGSEQEFTVLKETFIKSQQKAGKSREEAQEMFEAATGRLVSKAILDVAGIGPVPQAAAMAVEMGTPVARQFNTPENLLYDMVEHRDKIENILGPKHTKYMEGIAKILSRGQRTNVTVEGVTKKYTTNEGLSRFYNMARGMVSPLYVTSEFAVRVAAQANIDTLQLAAKNEQAAEIILKMMKTPSLVTDADVRTLGPIITEFVLTEMARADFIAPEVNEMFLLPEGESDEEQQTE